LNKIGSQEEYIQGLTQRSDAAIRQVREQLEEATLALRAREAELEASSDQRAAEANARCERLETEAKYLKRDLNKTEIRCKALQRDLVRYCLVLIQIYEKFVTISTYV